jgi:flagellin
VSITLNNATNAAITGANIGADVGGAGLTVETAADKQFAILQTGADATAANTTQVSLLDTRLTGGTSVEMTNLATAIQTFHTAANNNQAKASDATALITSLDTALNWVSSKRADLGAAQNRLGYAAASLSTTSQNVSAANAQIRDADVAAETANMSKSQILMQAGISVLAQANQASQLALKLLNG